jgi:hypothetical protein
MGAVAMDLLPGDAELARRAAGGDGAAFVRLYDHYAGDVFDASLAATGSVEIAADATQGAFLKLLRRPPALGAPASDVAARLQALALGGRYEPPAANGSTPPNWGDWHETGVGWLRSETVAKAGAQFDEDWSEHLWHPAAEPRAQFAHAERAPAKAPAQEARPRRRWRLPRLALPAPAPAAALLLLMLLTGAAGAILTQESGDPIEAKPAAATTESARDTGQADERQRARRPQADGAGRRARREAKPLLDDVKLLLAP